MLTSVQTDSAQSSNQPPRPVGELAYIQIGAALPFAREQTSAINKYRVPHVQIHSTGLVGDEQADPFFHGGPLQAVHQMPAEVYELIRQRWPDLTLYDGALGENFRISGMHEGNVCIGDIYQMGLVQLQVTRPRRPCWKIDAQLGQRGVAKALLDAGQIGWYYRVVQTGECAVGDCCYLLSRPQPQAVLAELWQVYHEVFDAADERLNHWLQLPELADSFKVSLRKRTRSAG